MSDKQVFWLMVLLSGAVAVIGVLSRPLLPVDETRYLSVAWEMFQNHNYLIPHKNGEIYTHKPPLLFWLINLVWAVTGPSEFAARLVGPAFGLASLFATVRLGRLLWPDHPETGWRAGVILAGFLVFSLFAGLTMFDSMLTLATLLGLSELVLATAPSTPQARRRGHWIGLGLALGLGVYAKGPVILLHILPPLLLYRLWTPAPRPWPRQILRGGAVAVLVALAVVALWLVPAIIAGGAEYRTAILWTQSAGRVTSSFAHARPVWTFLILAPALFFPWIWLPQSWRCLWRANWRDTGLRLCAIWFLSTFVLFSLVSGKQAHYLLPEYPALALMLARVLPGKFSRASVALAVLPVVVAGIYLTAIGLGLIPLSGVLELLQPRRAPLIFGLLLLILSGLVLRRTTQAGLAVLGLGVLLIINGLIAQTRLRPVYDAARLAKIAAPHEADGIAVINMSYNAEFNYTGRLTQPVAVLKTADLDAWISSHPKGVMIGRRDRAKPGWPARQEIIFMDQPYRIWFVSDKKE